MCAQVNLEGQRSTEQQPNVGYPDISFGVEDFDDAFKSLVRNKAVCNPLDAARPLSNTSVNIQIPPLVKRPGMACLARIHLN